MSYTKADIKTRVLEKLLVTGSGQSASDEDAEMIKPEEAAETLYALRIVDLTSQVTTDALLPAYMDGFCDYLAGVHGSVFGQPLEWCETARRLGEDKLRRVADQTRPRVLLRTEIAGLQRW